ncbi:MAG: cbb3-type cytochrome c oxidase subunit I [bacterium]
MNTTRPTYLAADNTLRGWLTTLDHKRIALLYLATLVFFFAIGGLAALLMRLELLDPASTIVSPDIYNRLFTLHGVIMVWFFLIPSIPAVLGNFLIPLMIGARDLAFPRLNLWSWYLFLIGGAFTLTALLVGGVDTGWTFYTPYSSRFSDTSAVLVLAGVVIQGFSSIFTALNFIVTTHRLRAPGMGWFDLPLFVWAQYATSIIIAVATPVLAMAFTLVMLERTGAFSVFDPTEGGDPLLYQHLFWFYSHPAVYIMILPGMGVVSEIITCESRKPIFGYRAMAYSLFGIAFIGFLVWGHHMFVSGQSEYASLLFSVLSFLVAVPSAIKVFNWTGTLWGGAIRWSAPMIYALAFVLLFTFGGLTGLFLATLAVDVHLHDTYFVVAHFHFIMVGGMVTAFLGGQHFWFPKITGRRYPERAARISALVITVGFVATFLPQFILGLQGMPRRYATYPEMFTGLHVASTLGVALLGVGYLAPLVYLGWSAWRGAPAGDNPWQAAGLEWQAPSPPPTHNFDTPPVVPEMPYDYRAEATDHSPA